MQRFLAAGAAHRPRTCQHLVYVGLLRPAPDGAEKEDEDEQQH